MAARIVKRKSPPKPEPVEIEEKEQVSTPPSLWRRLFPALFFMGVLAAMVFAFQGSDTPEKTRPTPKTAATAQKKVKPPQKTAAQKEIEIFKARYDELKKTFTGLDSDDVDRDDLLDLSQSFYELYEDAEHWPNGPAALYRAAEVMEFSAKHMDEEADYARAASLYEKIVQEFPQSILADDALYAAARVHGLHLDEPKKALLALAYLQDSYPQGDTIGKAKALEEKLLPPPKPVKPTAPAKEKSSDKKSVPSSKTPTKSENTALAEKKPASSSPKPASKKVDGPKEHAVPKERSVPELVYKPILMPASLFMSQAVHMLADLQQEPKPLVVNKVPEKVQPKKELASTQDKKAISAPAPKAPAPKAPAPKASVQKVPTSAASTQVASTQVVSGAASKKVEGSKVASATSTQKAEKINTTESTPKATTSSVKPTPSPPAKKEQGKKSEKGKMEPTFAQPSLWERATQSIMAFWKDDAQTQSTENPKSEVAGPTSGPTSGPKPATVSKLTAQAKTALKADSPLEVGSKLQAEQKKSLQPIPKPAPLPASLPAASSVAKTKAPTSTAAISKTEVKKPSVTQSKGSSLAPKAKNQEKAKSVTASASATLPKSIGASVKSVQKQENKASTMLRAEKASSPKTPEVKPPIASAEKTPVKPVEKGAQKNSQKPADKKKPADKQKVDVKSVDKNSVASAKPKAPLPVPAASKTPTMPAVDPLALTQELSEAELNARMRNAPKDDLAAQLGLSVRTVYVDIGHGGKDQGTAHNGLVESSVVLDIGKKVGDLLKSKGFNVVYSRTSNVFIPLSARSLSANEKGADLFVSIHMNAFVGPQAIQGFETYYLDFTRNAEASRVATLENAMSDRSLGDLQNLLAKMLLNVRTEESRGLARTIQKNTIGTLRAKGFATRDGGTRSAPFHVLIGTSMPAVLVEVGYCTSKVEAAWLKRHDYRNLLAQGIVQGIIEYKKQLEK